MASARDRKRLRERNAAERSRVERMLASAPPPNEADAETRIRSARHSPLPPRRAERPTACPLCGHTRVVSDEVMHGGLLEMSECLDCEHRWTTRPEGRWIALGARMNRSIEIRSRA